ncbi:uncharacterized protein LOC111642983 [Copidosoma floridanum]|uniref:uncharacterized protein LOC111642983 n=1 Tax=Copidosoma floridanum TaxID=29053 RepID=UPI000C6FC938|nr:uncharacterized protein LOC111642983 [Copidosoma floridanum]
MTIRQDNKPAPSDNKLSTGTFVRGIECGTFALHEISASVISRSIIVKAKHTGMQDKDDNSHFDLYKTFDVLEEFDIEKAMVTLHSDGVLKIEVPKITANE